MPGAFSFLISLWLRYNHFLDTRPVVTKCVTAGVIATAADVVCQINFPLQENDLKLPPLQGIYWQCTANFALLNTVFIPPIVQWWHGLLSTKIAGPSFGAAVQRVAMDQALFAPLFVAVFFLPLVSSWRESMSKSTTSSVKTGFPL